MFLSAWKRSRFFLLPGLAQTVGDPENKQILLSVQFAVKRNGFECVDTRPVQYVGPNGDHHHRREGFGIKSVFLT
jgi:hypothetical protein